MKRNIALLIWLTSLNLIAQYPTATLKIGTIYNPQAGEVLVPVTCEEYYNPIGGITFGWYIAYDTSVLYAGEPETIPTILNYYSPMYPSCLLQWIIADNPLLGWNTIALIWSCACCGEIEEGAKFFDILFEYTGGASEYPNIKWTSLGNFVTNMGDDDGNEFLLTLEDGYVGPELSTATLKLDSICYPQGGVNVSLILEEIDNPVGNNSINTFAFYIQYDSDVLGDVVNIVNVHPLFPISNYITYVVQDFPELGWNTIAMMYSSAEGATGYNGMSFFDLQFYYQPPGSEILLTVSDMLDDFGNQYDVNVINGYFGDCFFNEATFHVTTDGNNLEGAVVTVGSESTTTNSSGIAVFDLPDGDYMYTLTKEGFADEEGTFTVAGAPQLIEVEMEPCWDLVLHLIDPNGTTITDSALVIVNNDTVWSITGSAAFCVTDLTINYEVYIEGYYPNIGEVTIWPIPGTIEIIMDPILYNVTFFVNCCGEPLESIPITYEGQTVLTNAAGLAMLNMTAGFYSFEIEGVPITFTVPDTLFVPVDICSEVTFSVTCQGIQLEGALVTIDSYFQEITDPNGIAVFCLPDGDYDYTVTKEGYADEESAFTVAGEPQLIEVEMEVCFDVTIHVVSVGGPLTGCIITIGDYVFNNDTTSTVCLPDGSYPLTVTKEGYYPYSGSITVNGSPQIKNIILLPMSYYVTFHVTGNGNDLAGAWVTLGLVSLPTNASGIAVFSLPDGDYDYSVTKEGFADEEGTLTVAGAPQLIEVEMEECWDVIFQIGGCDSAAFYYNGEYLMIYPNDPLQVCLPNGYYVITIYNNGYFEQSAFEVNNSSATIEFDCPPLFYSVTFFVNCCGEPLEGIMLTIGSVTVITGANGLVSFNLTEGDYTVEIGGYIFNFSVPETSYVDADICSEVTFHLTSQGMPIEGASVTVGDETIWTNVNGEAVFCLQNGPYTYIISKLGYETLTGSFNVNGEPFTIEIWWPDPLYPVIFNLSALPCNNSFDDFIIVINGETISFGEYIYLFSGNYSFSVYLVGCSLPIESGNIFVFGAPMTIELVLSELPHVTFHVTDQWLADFEGAVINVEDDILITDAEGIASFCMTGGFHDYWVANPGYDTVPGNFVFPCQDTTIEFMLMTGSIGEEKMTRMDIYPNPSSGKFYFEAKNAGIDPIELQVMDLTGRIVYERQPIISEKFEIDLSGQPKGMYFLYMKTEKDKFTKKLIIQ